MIGFENPGVLLLILLVMPLAYLGYKKPKFSKFLVGAKVLALSLLIIGAASPFIETDTTVTEEPEIKVLEDNSASSSLITSEVPEFDEIDVTRESIASGNQTDISSGIMRNLERDGNYLLVSDLQSSESLEPVIDQAREKNASINILEPEFEKASSVTVEGPETTVPGAENRFTVRTYSTDEAPEPEVFVDGERVEIEQVSENSYTFERSFEQQGSHDIHAVIESDGELPETDRFYRTVKVSEPPKILVLGSPGSLDDQISQFYDLNYESSVPDDLDDYHSVIAKEPFEDEDLVEYVVEGNGLVYTGDMQQEKNLLPVRQADESDSSDGAEVMLLIHTSMDTGACVEGERRGNVCTETYGDGAITDSMQIAYNLIEVLPPNNRVGAMAYNTEPYLLSEPETLANHKDDLQTQISRLEPGGNTLHHQSLEAAVEQFEEDGNIVLISDGRITAMGENLDTREESLRIASDFEGTINTVGVDVRNQRFLQDLADEGGGTYLDADQSGRLNFMFQAGGAEDSAGGLVKVNNHHPVTEGLGRLETETAGFEQVEPKDGADLLITSESGQPFLTTWRYGLGRVASFSGGGEHLGITSTNDPELISRTLSWSVGQPERKQDDWLRVEDGREDEDVTVESSSELDGLQRTGEDLYTTELSVNETGFHEFEQESFGYSYNVGLESIGYKEENEKLALQTGGKIFEPENEDAMRESLKENATTETNESRSLGEIFIAASLIIFLAEIGVRKRKGKK